MTASIPGHTRYARPLWLVTMPTIGDGGRTGTQSFVVSGTTVQEAVAAAERRSCDAGARLRRRGARIDPVRASAVLHH